MLVTQKEEAPYHPHPARLLGEDYLRLTRRHFPAMKQPSATASNKHPTKVCKVCYARGIRTAKGLPVRTTYVCADCPSEPGLHIENCFKLYHTELLFYFMLSLILNSCMYRMCTENDYMTNNAYQQKKVISFVLIVLFK